MSDSPDDTTPEGRPFNHEPYIGGQRPDRSLYGEFESGEEAPVPAEDGWRGMESAPRDGAYVLLSLPEDDDGPVQEASWHGDRGSHFPHSGGWRTRHGWQYSEEDLRWQPLPLPPAPQKEGGE